MISTIDIDGFTDVVFDGTKFITTDFADFKFTNGILTISSTGDMTVLSGNISTRLSGNTNSSFSNNNFRINGFNSGIIMSGVTMINGIVTNIQPNGHIQMGQNYYDYNDFINGRIPNS